MLRVARCARGGPVRVSSSRGDRGSWAGVGCCGGSGGVGPVPVGCRPGAAAPREAIIPRTFSVRLSPESRNRGPSDHPVHLQRPAPSGPGRRTSESRRSSPRPRPSAGLKVCGDDRFSRPGVGRSVSCRGDRPPGPADRCRAGTSTYLPNMNVLFSHPSELYPQKDGRKVRSRDKSTFTLDRAPAARCIPLGALRTPAHSAPPTGITHLCAGHPGLFPPVRRDRSYSAPRSGQLRLDDSGAVVCRRDGRRSRAARPRGGSARGRGRRGAVLHVRVRSALMGTSESCGNMDSVAARIPLPCAQTPLGAHGSPATERDRRRESA